MFSCIGLDISTMNPTLNTLATYIRPRLACSPVTFVNISNVRVITVTVKSTDLFSFVIIQSSFTIVPGVADAKTIHPAR